MSDGKWFEMVLFYCSASALLVLFMAAGIVIGGSGGGKKDYSLGGRKAGAAEVTGILLGSLVGGASTVGTVQMAYSYGITAWWFTLGGGIGCLLLGLRFAVPLRRSRVTTIADYLKESYSGGSSCCGAAIAATATAASSIGTFVSICAQSLSCIALIRGILPLSLPAAAVVTALSIWGFIAFGGMKSFAKLSGAKIIILYITLLLCAWAALHNGGFSAIKDNLGFQPWFNIFGRGFFPELGYLASMITGVFTTQIYIQSFAAAKEPQAARAGAFASALLMPPMGLLGTAVGLSVRARGIDMQPDKVLSWFIMESFPPLIGGLLWGGIVITVIGCAAGLMLGVATNITKNLLPEAPAAERNGAGGVKSVAWLLLRPFELFREKAVVAVMTAAAAVIAVTASGSMILELSFLSMGLRGAGTFVPFVLAVMRPGMLPPGWALASCAGGLLSMLLWAAAGLPSDPLFAGLAVSAFCSFCGVLFKKKYMHV